MSEMEDMPSTVAIWDQIVKAIESKAKYTTSLTCPISDVKVTDIFYDWSGNVDSVAVSFWSQLLAGDIFRVVLFSFSGGTSIFLCSHGTFFSMTFFLFSRGTLF